ncbi:Fur family transcriptional regulator [Nocardia amamiensis]|uniref:Fur family transcriptional regulator n=1 Tax=Nocardia amamiensis TaxID=404578 RepID=UPI000830F53B|nr:transcriptional repressor [Nocardia amamiensis]
MRQPDRPTPQHTHPATAVKRQRTTAQRMAVLDALRHSDRFLSTQQLHAYLRRTSDVRIGLTTVYRALRLLADDQLVETQRSEHGELLYRRNNNTYGHRHYLLCRICGRAEELAVDDVEDYVAHVAAESRYSDISHSINLYGVCPHCAPGTR